MKIKTILAAILIGTLAISLTGCDDFTIAMNDEEEAFIENSDGDPLIFENYNNALAVIDSGMESKYIEASLAALEEFNRVDNVFIDFIITDIDTYTGPYDIIFIQYNDELVDYCSEDDSNVVACNSLESENEYLTISSTVIAFNDSVLDILAAEWTNNVAIHELGHTFGLIDLYPPVFEEISIMYFQAEDIILEGLTEWDIANLNFVYGD